MRYGKWAYLLLITPYGSHPHQFRLTVNQNVMNLNPHSLQINDLAAWNSGCDSARAPESGMSSQQHFTEGNFNEGRIS